MNKISPMVALVIAACILILLGGVYLFRNSQSGQELTETSKRGQETGNRMMMGGADAKQAMAQKTGTTSSLEAAPSGPGGGGNPGMMMGGDAAKKMMMERMKGNSGSR
jgi:hypothetical protein